MESQPPPQKQPKVILFDIGGVCVVSPFQAILDYELSLGIPPGWVNFSISNSAPNGFWHRLERGAIPMDAAFFAGFNRDLHDVVRWEAFYHTQREKNPHLGLPVRVPTVPEIDGERLFNEMMRSSQGPDPWMFPALKSLKASGKYIIAALSNTVIFPPGHDLYTENPADGPVRRIFDIFISSAHVGLRKPDPEIYKLALDMVSNFATQRAAVDDNAKRLGWGEGVQAGEILFLDDIGENLRAAKSLGFQTIKVHLGQAFEAVDELERVTGLKLAGDHPKIPSKLSMKGPKARM